MTDTATDTPAAPEAPATETPAPVEGQAAPAEAAKPAETPPEPEKPAEETPKGKEFAAIAKAQKKLHNERKALEAEHAAKLAEVEAKAADITKKAAELDAFRQQVTNWESDPQAVITALGIDPAEFMDTWVRKHLDIAPSADDRVSKIEKQLAKERADAKAKAEEAEKKAAEEAEKAEAQRKAAEEKQYADWYDGNVKQVTKVVTAMNEQFPLSAFFSETATPDIVDLGIAWYKERGEELPLVEAAKLVEERLVSQVAERMKAMMDVPALKALAAQYIGASSPPAASAEPPATSAAAPTAKPEANTSTPAVSRQPRATTIPVGRAAPTTVPVPSRMDAAAERQSRLQRYASRVPET